MKVKIYNENGTDFVVLSGDISYIQKQAKIEAEKRGWENPYSEIIEGDERD